ncbi:MAG: zinc ABC transporter substrate-binding protein [Candidatus Brocadia sp. AMX2]|uniref:Periplasmic zinc binding protein n=1 Tax=Candidatus Brocadia sinica JPN1 TaxID=1197129 RepID=A0ABQ0JYU1_9BACT|nr:MULTISPECIES: metal ABC transporter substrate-binding protein [Brocadia]KXK25012.1 MAG: ABC transporter substrate binding component [Candidatus Brocadia sinica]MBC6932324.1 zinc ABC transporter substrate-binding protein [Candidatus Brocadia sp.]MBL1169860.1 zinc ABC transporter substrate-binding protein [Candidatus Brocadia sp. AMX1]NOG40303.1 zinc ABC transporter substrate-binding protein [Planctomycetota bacterium]KAA0243773.1 MAG: zinc ABC transporter substrate-binding protein [Candidatu
MKIKYQLCLSLLFALSWVSVAHAKLNIVATTSDLGSLAKEIGRDKVEVTNIAKPTEDPHFVDAKPGFIVKLNKADMLIEGGLQLEIGWLPNLVIGARNQKILVGNPGYLIASTGIQTLEVPDPSVTRAAGDIHPFGNPHFMLDPLNGKIVATHICDRLCEIDATNCNYYKDNLKDFTKRLDQKFSEWQKMLEPFRGTKIVTYHKTFPYFAQRFGLNVAGALEPKPGIPPSPAHINNLVPMMKNEGVQLILIEQFRERKIPEFVAERTGAKVVVLPIMVGGQKEIEDYLSLFDYTINQIVMALKTKS